MKPIVLYSTRSGNTEKVAKAIAQELNCPCVKITKVFNSSLHLNSYDLVFAGTGIYKGQPHADLLLSPRNKHQWQKAVCAFLDVLWLGKRHS